MRLGWRRQRKNRIIIIIWRRGDFYYGGGWRQIQNFPLLFRLRVGCASAAGWLRVGSEFPIPSTYADLPRGRTIMGSTCANFGSGVRKIEEGDINTMAATRVLVDDGSSLRLHIVLSVEEA